MSAAEFDCDRPPRLAAYRDSMTRFVIDPPTLVLLAEGGRPIDPAHQLVAPNSIRSQALDLLLQSVHAGELTEKAALDLHERMTELKIRVLGDRVSRRLAWRTARKHNWTTIRDAEYLAIAKLQADALVATDPDLADKASGLVPLARVSDLFLPSHPD
jgi:predicted nucleic acid-binding protein